MNFKTRENAVLLVDAMNLLHRSFYAYPNLISKDGRSTGAFYGFVNYLKSLRDKFNPKHIIVCSDASRKSFRNEIYPDYKGTRKDTDEELRSQFGLMEAYIKLANIKFIKMNGFEADDLIGTLSQKAKEYGLNPYIVSGDTDLQQLVNEDIKQLYLGNSGITYYGINEVIAKYGGLTPAQLIDFKALKGDTSDNIPGIAGIGEKTAIKLLNEYKTLDGVYKNVDKLKGKQKEKIENGKENAYMSQRLVTIKCDIGLDFEDLFDTKDKFELSSRDAVMFLRGLDIKLFKNEEIVDIEKKGLKLPFEILEDIEENICFRSLLKYSGCSTKESMGIYLYSLLFDKNNREKLKELLLNAKQNLINEDSSNLEEINKIEEENKEIINLLNLN